MEVATPTTARQRGLTLLELLTTLAVAIVLVGIAIPSWGYLTQGNALLSARNQMRTLLAQARLAAVTHNQPVTLCPSIDRVSCSNDHTTWHQGYLLFVDNDGDKQMDPGERLLRAANIAEQGILIHSSPGRRAIRYARDGSAWGSNVSIRFCVPSAPDRNKALVLYGTGRTRLSDRLGDGSRVHC